jgi:hypothetical protein
MSLSRRITESREAREEARADRFAQRCTPSRALSAGTYQGATSGEAVHKECPLQHAGYMAAVRALGYCMLCRRSCRPQFCHADQGKGERMKTDVRRGWPGCGPGDWGNGCHWLVGTSGQYEKEQRRQLEADLAWRTREAIKAAGTWPKGLPMLEETDGVKA